MDVGVSTAAEYLQVSQRRVRKLIADHVIPARREGGRWLIDEAELVRSVAISRPMAPRIAWSLINLLDGEAPAHLRSDERRRLLSKIEQLRVGDRSLDLLRSWVARRASRMGYAAALPDVPDLVRDPRLVPSGISDERSGLSSAHEAEGYIRTSDLAGFVSDHLLVRRGPTNVWLHVCDQQIARPAPTAVVIADLADSQRPRETAAAHSLLNSLLR